jgi:microcystin-dependent protein
MSSPFIGQVKMVGFNFNPVGYLRCDGSLQSIANYDALFALIGTTYGGDGFNTFAVPDLRGRMPIHQGQGLGLSSYFMGQAGGAEQVTLTTPQLPAHTHALSQTVTSRCQSGAGNSKIPTGNYHAADATGENYSTAGNDTMGAIPFNTAIATAGENQPHDNMPPYLCVNFIIASEGIFPSRN